MKNRILFKTLIFLLALCMAVSICGCSNADSGSAQASSSANSDAGFSTDKKTASISETPASSFEYEEKDGGIMITKFAGTETQVSVPSVIDGKSVTHIGAKAFDSCSQLTEIILPDSITLIQMCAFNGCTNLTSFTVPETVTELGNDALKIVTL